ncbi:hypothetical protein [Rubritalea halochordaticola]
MSKVIVILSMLTLVIGFVISFISPKKSSKGEQFKEQIVRSHKYAQSFIQQVKAHPDWKEAKLSLEGPNLNPERVSLVLMCEHPDFDVAVAEAMLNEVFQSSNYKRMKVEIHYRTKGESWWYRAEMDVSK